MPVDLKDGLSPLERALERYIENSQNTLDSLSREMREFKDEMKEFKDEIRMDTENFKNAIQSDTKTLQVELQEFKDKMEKDHREMNRQWVNLAIRTGGLVTDIFMTGVKKLCRSILIMKSLVLVLEYIKETVKLVRKVSLM